MTDLESSWPDLIHSPTKQKGIPFRYLNFAILPELCQFWKIKSVALLHLV
jgi:hypothetical protein